MSGGPVSAARLNRLPARVSDLAVRHWLKDSLVSQGSWYPFRGLPSVTDPYVASIFGSWSEVRSDAWVYDVRKPAWLEPRRGYVIGAYSQPVRASLPYWREIPSPGFRALTRDYMKGRISGVAVDRFETVLSLRGHDEANYYHFFDDLLPRLRLIEELGLPQDVTVLVGRKLYEASYFQDAVNRSVFASLRFVPHINVVRANRLVFGHPGSLRIANFEFNVRALRTATPEPDPARLLFLTRARARGRYLSNEDAVQAEMRAAGFDVVETDGMSLDDQIAMFSGAAAVVAVHGAGVANIQFRMGRPMVLVELFAPDYVRPPFAWLCGQLGFRYDAVLGSSFDAAGAFAVDPRKLRMRVEELLAAEGA